MKLTDITITRRGDLTFPVHGPTHCGSNSMTLPVTIGRLKTRLLAAHWTIRARATAESLDSRGFLFDQSALDALVHETATRDSYDSCERLAVAIGEVFCRAVKRENGACILADVEVTLSPTPYLSDITIHMVPNLGGTP